MVFARLCLLPLGAACLLLGLAGLRAGLGALPGRALSTAMGRLCAGPLRAYLFGAVAAAALQSSSAVTVALMALTADGVLSQKRAMAVLLGANLGTTCTAQLLGNGAGLSPARFWPTLFLAGLILPVAFPHPVGRGSGRALQGLALLFCGLRAMAVGAIPLLLFPPVKSLFASFDDPLAGFCAGAAGAGLLQSSTAAIAMLQALSATGILLRSGAVAAVLGQNLGSCVPSAFAAPGGGRHGKRVAAANFIVNLSGGLPGILLLYVLKALCPAALSIPADAAFIANFHTVYNLLSSLLFLPLSGHLAALCQRIFPD